jgi:hypothetical protein
MYNFQDLKDVKWNNLLKHKEMWFTHSQVGLYIVWEKGMKCFSASSSEDYLLTNSQTYSVAGVAQWALLEENPCTG